MNFFNGIDQCLCGQEFKKGEVICHKCGRKKYRMSLLPGKEDSVEITMRKMRDVKNFVKKIGAFQLARTKNGY